LKDAGKTTIYRVRAGPLWRSVAFLMKAPDVMSDRIEYARCRFGGFTLSPP
jgi:hypothetical protein